MAKLKFASLNRMAVVMAMGAATILPSFAAGKTGSAKAGVVGSTSVGTATSLAPEDLRPWRLEPIARTVIPARMKFARTTFGGISAIAYHDDHLFLLSDDRGRTSPSRFYEAEMQLDPPRLEIRPTVVHPLKNVPGVENLAHPLDPEGLARLPDGSFLITSEADTNRKPREPNRLLRVTGDGLFLAEFKWPSEVQPEETGRQTRGTHNNAGPEGLTRCQDGSVWTALERSLVQDREHRRVRWIRWEDRGDGYVPVQTKFYNFAPARAEDLFRGVSEILCLDDFQFLVIERTLVFRPTSIVGYGGGLFLADCRKEVCEKRPVLGFEDLKGFRNRQRVANFEGLALGPTLKDGTRTVIMVSDDNFDRRDGTEFIVFALKR